MRFNIGERLKQVLDLEPSTLIEYKHHQIAMQDMSTFRYRFPNSRTSYLPHGFILLLLPASSRV